MTGCRFCKDTHTLRQIVPLRGKAFFVCEACLVWSGENIPYAEQSDFPQLLSRLRKKHTIKRKRNK